MRKRRTTLPPPADEPEPETDGASPSKRRAFGKKVAAAVSRIEAVDAAAKPVGEELPRDRQCAFCGQRGNEAVLRGESIAADDWDWESLEPDQETEAPSSSEAADAAAFAARRDDGAEWEEAAFNSLDD